MELTEERFGSHVSVFTGKYRVFALFPHQTVSYRVVAMIQLSNFGTFIMSCVANSYVSNDSFYVPHHTWWGT